MRNSILPGRIVWMIDSRVVEDQSKSIKIKTWCIPAVQELRLIEEDCYIKGQCSYDCEWDSPLLCPPRKMLWFMVSKVTVLHVTMSNDKEFKMREDKRSPQSFFGRERRKNHEYREIGKT